LVDVKLKGILTVTPKARGLVIFVHGSGSSRLSPRNLFVAQTLNHVGLATLLFDLLTEEEDAVYANRFNIPLLTQRLIAVTNWASRQKEAKEQPGFGKHNHRQAHIAKGFYECSWI